MRPDRRVLFAVMLAAVAGLTACDRTDGVGDLTAPAAPQFSKNGNAREFKIIKTATPLTQDVTFSTQSPVNKHGGLLEFGGHSLLIQRNSVQSPTHFQATIRAGDYIRIDLRAWETNGTPVTQFKVPVKLTIDLSQIADQGDLAKVIVVYHNPNGTLELVPSAVDPQTKKITASLNHFSDYSPGWGKNDPPPPTEEP